MNASSKVLDAIGRHAQQRPQALAFVGARSSLNYRDLDAAIDALSQEIRRRGWQRIALLADNGFSWAVAELAILKAGGLCVPLPAFFSPMQIAHALANAAIDTLLIDARIALPVSLASGETAPLDLWPASASALRVIRLPVSSLVGLPEGTCKITYTSGTTGEPKGVCLGIEEQERVAEALWQASASDQSSRHLSVLPLSTLLENIGGLYAPLLAGATACLWPLAEVGLSGATQVDAGKLLDAIRMNRASSVILVPQMLMAMVAAIEAGLPRPDSLRFVAVGGASVSPRLLKRAQALGLPVLEGYGLSECASVVALNRVSAQRPDTVGRPLPHLQVRIADDGEILVSGNGFRGYVGDVPRDPQQAVATGDVGHLDVDGYLHISGRKKNIFVTSFGRNVAPEWLERELCQHPSIAQAVVFGEAVPFNVAVIVARAPGVDAAIAALNRMLPDYARIHKWIPAVEAFTAANDQCTANGRLRRAQIRDRYASAIDSLYRDDAALVSDKLAAPV